jgi:hypothetical protein
VASSTSWADESNKSFRVEITLDSTPPELRAGVTAKVEIQVETLEDAVQCPIHAIVPEGGKHLAWVVKGSSFEEREVHIGKNSAHLVQILEGLSEGEEVLLYDPRSESGTRVGAEGKAAAPAEPESVLPGALAAEHRQ